MSENIKVLLVEDEASEAMILKEALAEPGPVRFEVDHVSRLSEAREILASGKYDAVLLDLSLPDSSGIETYNEISKSFHDIPVVVQTIIEDEAVAVEAVQRGAQDYIVKRQIEGSFVRRTLRYAIERKHIRDEITASLERERSARHQAEQASRAKDEFLMTLSHELRTPLSAIIGWCDLISSNTVKEKDVRGAVDVIERNAKSLNQLLNDLFEMSRIISGKVKIEPRPINMMDVLREAMESVSLAASNKNIELLSNFENNAVMGYGDPDRLKQVIWNLLTNSIKFTPKGGKVEISLQTVGSIVRIEVRDNGIGIDPELLPHIFDKFTQGDSAASRQYHGLGLGLSLVRHLVELHGGIVKAESEGPGKGSTFTVDLRRSSSKMESPDRRLDHNAADAERLKGRNILVVDDEATDRELMKTILLRFGAEVQTAGSAEEAMKKCGNSSLDVIVTDIGMPGEDGYTLIRKIRQAKDDSIRSLPAIAVTAYAGEEGRRRAFEAGFQLHMSKPVSSNDLVTAIKDLADRAGRPKHRGLGNERQSESLHV